MSYELWIFMNFCANYLWSLSALADLDWVKDQAADAQMH